MLITITYKGENTQNLGFLLHKNPYRPQSFDLSYGKAYVFYPEISDEQTTAALLLDINPLDLAKGKVGSNSGGLFDYVNDRPYVCSSFMSNAISRVFGTALSGKCASMQELADTVLDLTACVYNLPCQGNEELIREVFEPLGYAVETTTDIMDEKFTEWGPSRYVNLTLTGKVRLADLLNHLYVLIPVFDRQKHYYVAEDEIEKLMRHGEGWLAEHPAKNKIIRRYFLKQTSYANKAILSIAERETAEDEIAEDEIAEDEIAENDAPETDALENQTATGETKAPITEAAAMEPTEKKVPLNNRRLEAVKRAVLDSGAKSVLDLGCGECKLTAMLLAEQQILRVTAADVSASVLLRAKQRLHYERMNENLKQKLTLLQSSLTYKDDRFSGFDCACVVEVIEHLDSARLPSFERAVFEFAAPRTVVLTTPNREYNINYEFPADMLRHSDHRFEWTRQEFKDWTAKICEQYGYTVKIHEIGDADANVGAPTQMGVFTKCR